MSAAALALVLLAALCHATWNLLARRAADRLVFLWCSTVATAVLFLPLGGWLLLSEPVPSAAWAVLALSVGLEALYYWALAQAYRYGDLSLVYPIARGTAPVFVPVLAAGFLGERLSPLAAGGVALVAVGTILLHARRLGRPTGRAVLAVVSQPGTRYALVTGLLIASYSTVDKYGVTLVTPLLYGYLLFAGLSVALLPLVAGQGRAVRRVWRQQWPSVVAVGLLTPAAYGLVLVALTLAPVSYVAAAREVSVVVAALLGRLVLHEGYGPQRLLGSTSIAAGLALLVLG